MHYRGVIVFMFLLRFLILDGQVKISGNLYDRETGRPISDATIQVDKHTALFFISDSTGNFQLTVPGLPCALVIRHLSYEPLVYAVKDYQDYPLELYLTASENTLEEIFFAAPQNNARDNELRRVSLRSEAIDRLTSGFGEADIIRTLQSMPGIQKSSEINAALNVRGTGHGNNRIRLDGQDLHNSYHLMGIAPMFNPDILESITLHKSGFHPRSGNALSSFLNVETRKPDLYDNNFSASLSNLSGGIHYEGPLVSGKMSLLAAARYSYFDLVKTIYDNLHSGSENFKTLPGYRLHDIFLRLHFLPGKEWQGDLTVFHTEDRFNYERESLVLQTDWKNRLYSFNLTRSTDPFSHIKIHSGLSAYNFSGKYNPAFDILRQNDLLSWENEIEYGYFGEKGVSWQAGAFSSVRFYYLNSQEQVLDRTIRSAENVEYSFYSGIYGNLRFPINSWMELEKGIRLSYYRHIENYFRMAPRIQLNARQGNMAMNISYDRTYHYAHLISPLGFNMPADLWYPAGGNIAPQHADQYALHLSYDPGVLKANFGIFYKNMENLGELAPGAELISFQPADALINGSGEAYGIETGIHAELEDFRLDLYYTYSRSRRFFCQINDGAAFSPPYDLPHQVDINMTGDISTSWSWNLTWFWASGVVTTMPTGYAFLPHGGETLPYPLYTKLYNFRMPPSHRMDATLQYRVDRPAWNGRLSIGVYNLYHNSNPYFLYFTIGEEASGDIQVVPQKMAVFPFTPFLNLKIQWR